MRTSVGFVGATRSTGRYWTKSLKTAAVCQTSSSILPSMTGALSNFFRAVGVFFSGVSRAARRAAFVVGSAAFDFTASVVEGAPEVEVVSEPGVVREEAGVGVGLAVGAGAGARLVAAGGGVAE